MSEKWLGCPNCVFAFPSEKEYRHNFESDHVGRKYRRAELVGAQGG